jgi:signal peptidase
MKRSIFAAVRRGAGAVLPASVLAMVLLLAAGIRPCIVVSGSMEPALKTGSLAWIDTGADFDRQKEGAIIAYRMETGMLVMHRVRRVAENGLVTKGDANQAEDRGIVTEEKFYGALAFAVPGLGYAVQAVRTPGGMLLAGSVVLCLFLRNRISGKRKKEKEICDKE